MEKIAQSEKSSYFCSRLLSNKMNKNMLNIPEKLKKIMDKNQGFSAKVLSTISPFADILKVNSLCFFSEYTDHGISHIENTLKYTESLIADETFQYLTPEEVGVMIFSVVLHDIGMHTSTDMFKNMIEGEYDSIPGLFPNDKTWKQLWHAYLYDSQYWNDEKKKNVFGDSNHIISNPNLSDLQGLTEYDNKLIGEFIRLHHCRIAQEVSIKGFIGESTIPFEGDGIEPLYIKIAGIVARSHGMDVRDTFDYLEKLSGDRSTPMGIHAVYLMVLLRLADYLQIDSSRTSETLLNMKKMNSPYSLQEHKTHLSISGVQFSNPDKEKILIQACPQDAQTYVKIERLSEDIQKELDHSWAILGEVYTDYNYKLRYRRITTNISNERFKNNLDYVPEQFGFRYNNDLFKLLIAPLYGDNPLYGVRELVQNAVDACRLCMNDVSAAEEPSVIVKVDTEKRLFTITDTGKGMNLYEIKNYFLTIGSSYNDNIDWKKTRDQEHIFRTGRFGIGVLAAFLLGPEMTVVTRKRNESIGYYFSASMSEKFIQIKKEPNANFGTTIVVKCDELCIDYFKRRNKWYRWYIDTNPKVEYYLDNKYISYKSDKNEYKVLDHSSRQFGTVLWKPFNLLDYNLDDKECLYCNGFLITKKTRKKEFSNNWGIIPIFDPIRIPSLIITDKYNELPLNLQRNNIEDSVIYDFEPELAKAIFIDMICQLMATDINNISLDNINKFYFHTHGFSFKTDYTKSCIKEKWGITIFLNSDRIRRRSSIYKTIKELLDRINKNDYCIHIINTNRLLWGDGIYATQLENRKRENLIYNEYVAINGKAHNKIFNNYFKNGLLDNYKDWQLHTPNNPELEKEALIKDIINLDEDLFTTIHIKRIKKKTIQDTIFDDIFDKYMNRDPIIPYNMADRKQKFPLVFREYSKIIEHYIDRNNYSSGGRGEVSRPTRQK